jgi:hypothetical protein
MKLAEIFLIAGALAGRPNLISINEAIDPGQNRRAEAYMARLKLLDGPTRARSLGQRLAPMYAGRA